MKILRRLLLVVVIAAILLPATGMMFLGEIPVMLVFGWMVFLEHVIPNLQLNIAVVIEGIGAILVLFIGAHLFLSWLYPNLLRPEHDTPERCQWKLRWTGAGLMIFVLMFTTSIALTGLIHQTGWLAREPWLDDSSAFIWVRQDMYAIERALESYQVDWGHFPVTHGTVEMQDAGLPPAYYEGAHYDHWETPYYYNSNGHSYVLRSYGKNRVLGGGRGKFDDIVYSNGQFLYSSR